jgi:menaquinol-cytochrome c reductase cytochrome b/c subunit
MNQQEKEQYLREYSILKKQGKPFFPYAVAHDSMMAVIVMAVIIFLALYLGDNLGPKVDPTTTTYVPRPDWYFYFLFEVLRVMKNIPKFTDLATIGVPTICMILLFLLPLAFLTYSGANTGSPNSVSLKPPSTATASEVATFRAGELVVGQSGCEACHQIGSNGNNGPGPNLTHIGSELRPAAIASTLRNPTSPMPSFAGLAEAHPQKFSNLIQFLGMLQ